MLYLDLLIGYATSIVPTNVITSAYYNNLSNGDDVTDLKYFDYVGSLRNTPVFFALVNVIVMMVIDKLYEGYDINPRTRFLVAGLIIALIYSNLGRFYLQIPQRVLKMPDPIMFNLYAIITWIIVYFIVYLIRDSIMN